MRPDKTSSAREDDRPGTGQGLDPVASAPETRVTVYEAADLLGVTVDALRKRIQRGTIPHERHEDGRVYVLLDKGALRDAAGLTSGDVPDEGREYRPVRYRTGELVESLRDQIEFLRRELERKDAILLRMAERLPELEHPTEIRDPSEAAEPVSNGVGEPAGASEEPATELQEPAAESAVEPEERRSWIRRFFGL